MENPLHILRLDSSARKDGSVSRDLADLYIDKIAETRPVQVNHRDLSTGLPVITQDWVGSTFTPAEQRSPNQITALSLSDQLVDEVEQADLLIISTPIYNFSIPASLKLWIDQIARVGRTFQYTETGPVGLLRNKTAVILVASGGTQVGSEIDFATPYLRHVLGFVGIQDVEILAADQLMAAGPEKLARTKDKIRQRAA